MGAAAAGAAAWAGAGAGLETGAIAASAATVPCGAVAAAAAVAEAGARRNRPPGARVWMDAAEGRTHGRGAERAAAAAAAHLIFCGAAPEAVNICPCISRVRVCEQQGMGAEPCGRKAGRSAGHPPLHTWRRPSTVRDAPSNADDQIL